MLACAVLLCLLAPRAQAEPAWSESDEVTGLALVSTAKSMVYEIRLTGGGEFAFVLARESDDMMAQLLLEAYRTSGKVRILADSQVVVLYQVEHAAKTQRKVKVLGVRIGQ